MHGRKEKPSEDETRQLTGFQGCGLLSPKKNGPGYERLGGSGGLILSVMPAAVFEPTAAHSVIG